MRATANLEGVKGPESVVTSSPEGQGGSEQFFNFHKFIITSRIIIYNSSAGTKWAATEASIL